MNCLRCTTPNEEGAKFCKNCGMDLSYTPIRSDTNKSSNQTITLLLILIGWRYIVMLTYLLLNKVLFKSTEDIDWEKRQKVYDITGWTFDIIEIVMLTIFLIIIKNKTAKIFLGIFLLFEIVFFLIYRVFDK